MIFRHAEHQHVFGSLPVGLAKLPERAADRIQPGRRHVDGAETAMCRIVWRAELARPVAGQRLTLVAPGKEGELTGIRIANSRQPLDRRRQGFIPRNLLELAAAPWSDPPQRCPQLSRRQLLHNAGCPLGAQHTAVDRMLSVALDIAKLAAAQMDLYPAPAGAHVARRIAHFVADDG